MLRVSKLCRFCGQPFQVHPCRKDVAEYCCRACAYASFKMRTIDQEHKPTETPKTCEFCGDTFYVHPYEKDLRRWCSPKCATSARRLKTWGGPTKRCSRCGEIKAIAEFFPAKIGYSRCASCREDVSRLNASYRREWAREKYRRDVVENPEKLRAKRKAQTARYHNNPEFRARRKMSSKMSRGKRRDHKANNGGGGTVKVAQWRDILELHGNACAYCGATDIPLTQDHVIPLSRGGRHSTENLVPACASCNDSKLDKMLSEWLTIRPDIKRKILERNGLAA